VLFFGRALRGGRGSFRALRFNEVVFCGGCGGRWGLGEELVSACEISGNGGMYWSVKHRMRKLFVDEV